MVPYVVDFDNDVKASFEAILKKLKEIALDWAYPTSLESDILPVPENILEIGDMLTTVNGDETFREHQICGILLASLSQRFLPTLYGNVVKGGSDTTTKLTTTTTIKSESKCITEEEKHYVIYH